MAELPGTPEGDAAIEAWFAQNKLLPRRAVENGLPPPQPNDHLPHTRITVFRKYAANKTFGLMKPLASLTDSEVEAVLETAERLNGRYFYEFTSTLTGTKCLSLTKTQLNNAYYIWRREERDKNRSVYDAAYTVKGLSGNVVTIPNLVPIPSFPGYFASKDGRIFSVKEIKTTTPKGKRRHYVKLQRGGEGGKRCAVKMSRAQAVLAAKLGHWLKDGETVDHVDRNPANDHMDNLRPASISEQQDNGGTVARGCTKRSTVSVSPINEMRPASTDVLTHDTLTAAPTQT